MRLWQSWIKIISLLNKCTLNTTGNERRVQHAQKKCSHPFTKCYLKKFTQWGWSEKLHARSHDSRIKAHWETATHWYFSLVCGTRVSSAYCAALHIKYSICGTTLLCYARDNRCGKRNTWQPPMPESCNSSTHSKSIIQLLKSTNKNISPVIYMKTS